MTIEVRAALQQNQQSANASSADGAARDMRGPDSTAVDVALYLRVTQCCVIPAAGVQVEAE